MRLTSAFLFFCLPALRAEVAVDFNRQIRPILSENCFFCHGPDAKQRKAKLRLDIKESAYHVIKPGDSAGSKLIQRITAHDPDELMPPPESKRKLSSAGIATLKQWVDAGAPWGEHWAFLKVERPAVPQVESKQSAPVRNAIDNFIQARLEREGLAPSPEAGRRTLLRRLSLDLTGMSPKPEEVAAFVNDRSEDAYEKVVDRLLESPAYGERMAWDWLDAARYADSNGYQGDGERTMWPWRDWVVNAFNNNLPYDKFTIWQLAGDLLPDATREQQLATGFCRNHMINGEGGRIAEENRIDYVMDMTETMGTVWMGLTVTCSRCHDHKYDPLTQRDYYGLFAFFNQTPVNGGGGNAQTPPVLPYPGEGQEQLIAELEKRIVELNDQLSKQKHELAGQQPEWEKGQLSKAGESYWKILKPETLKAEHQKLSALDDQSILAGGPNPRNDTYTITAVPTAKLITGIRLEAIRHESMFKGGLARSDSGNFVLTEFEVLVESLESDKPEQIKIASAEATYEQGSLKVQTAFDGNPNTGWAIYEGRPVDKDHQAVFRLAEPLVVEEGSSLIFVLRHQSVHANHNLGRFRLSISSEPEPKLSGSKEALLAALRTPQEKRNNEQTNLVFDAFLTTVPAFNKVKDELKKAEGEINNLKNGFPKVMVMQDMAMPRKTFTLVRGSYLKPDQEVTATTPVSLPPLANEAPRNRLGLASWLVSPDHPLTARVTVNRFWQQIFGIGLVKTTEDFGVQGERPVQPELLDWLSTEFIRSGWNVKALLKLFVMSHAYRQESKATPELIEKDPLNRLLARGPRYRIPAWMLRDQALAYSGLLVDKKGGPPVNGYQPPGVWEGVTFGNKRYTQGKGEALYRRSLYTFWRRIIAPTMFFDNATRQTCTVNVLRTNTPLHALLTLNDVTFVEAARSLAERVMADAGDNSARLESAYQRVLGRQATKAEATIMLKGLERSNAEFAKDMNAAKDLLSVGESKGNEKLDVVEHASWTAVCLALMNLDETLSKE